jgi:hypothetical protein
MRQGGIWPPLFRPTGGKISRAPEARPEENIQESPEMIGYVVHYIVALLAAWLLVLQLFDIHSTFLALRLPWVREVGDTEVGGFNISGWAQVHLGWCWPVIKLPLAVFAPLIWTPAPILVEIPLILLLIAVDMYFLKIVRENYDNAKSIDPRRQVR